MNYDECHSSLTSMASTTYYEHGMMGNEEQHESIEKTKQGKQRFIHVVAHIGIFIPKKYCRVKV